MVDCEITLASSSDSDLLSKISWASKKYWGYPDEWMNLWKEGLTITEEIIDRDDVYKLVLSSQIIGFVVISHDSGSYEIEHCWILPEFIGKGYGSHLLDRVLRLPAYRAKPFKVIADPNAVPFYQKFGFKTVSETLSQPEGRTLPLMEMTNHVH